MTDERVAELRKVFQHRLESEDPKFHPSDVARIDSDQWLKRLLLHHDGDLKMAENMGWEALLWRKTVGASDINEFNINADYLNEGSFFPHGRDIDGKLILIFKCKYHVKGTKDLEELKRVIIYWFDRVERLEKGEQITLFFDMDGTGLSNMDMELTKYLIALPKLYYPYMLNYIIIFEMPWVLSAAFKVIKQLLPAKAVSIMKFLNQANLKDYVPPEEALACWGGKSDYQFKFTPENDNVSPDHTPKKVTFAEHADQHSPGEMLRLNPSDTIVFKCENDDISGQFTLTNMDESAVSFKIRTNSPEKFRVRPSTGTLFKSASQTITIVLQPGFQLSQKDRFLVLCIQIPNTALSPEELSDVWKKSSNSKTDEYRLKCQFPEKESRNGILHGMTESEKQIANFVTTVRDLQNNVSSMNRHIKTMKFFQLLTVVLLFMSIGLSFLLYKKFEDGLKGQCHGI